MSEVTLRPARDEDCERVWRWNFDPEVRARSKSRGTVSLGDHERWYRDRMTAGAFWIIELCSQPVGVVRIDLDGRISIVVDAEVRGHGVARRAIGEACSVWGRAVIAEILSDNLPSRACFEASGFRFRHETGGLTTYDWSP